MLRYFVSLFAILSWIFVGAAVSAMSSSSSSSSSSKGPKAVDAGGISRSSVKATIDFLTIARGLKTTPRTGWIRQEAGPRIESVADHSWRIALMSWVASTLPASSGVDTNKCLRMALVHDLAEAQVGDITPHCGVSDSDKHQQELSAITQMTNLLGSLPQQGSSPVGEEILDLWKEYEEGTSMEAKLVKDMDKLEMILQAMEYESDGKNGKSLDGFFDSTRDKWRTDIGRAWGQEIESRRTNATKT